MKFNWQQSGMPTALVSRMGMRSAFADYKSVLRDAQNLVMTPVDAEGMAKELAQADGRDYVEMVRELTASLAQAKQELDEANRRYQRLTSDLARRGIPLEEEAPLSALEHTGSVGAPPPEKVSVADSSAEWEDWDRKFRSLLG